MLYKALFVRKKVKVIAYMGLGLLNLMISYEACAESVYEVIR